MTLHEETCKRRFASALLDDASLQDALNTTSVVVMLMYSLQQDIFSMMLDSGGTISVDIMMVLDIKIELYLFAIDLLNSSNNLKEWQPSCFTTEASNRWF